MNLKFEGKKVVLDDVIVRNIPEACDKIVNLRLNTVLTVRNTNSKIVPHIGEYILLNVQEYGESMLFYVSGRHMVIELGHTTFDGILGLLHFNVSDGCKVRVLNSGNKQAYRLIKCENDKESVVAISYKNKSSQIVTRTYMYLYDAIKQAARRKQLAQAGENYKVVTPKGTVLLYL